MTSPALNATPVKFAPTHSGLYLTEILHAAKDDKKGASADDHKKCKLGPRGAQSPSGCLIIEFYRVKLCTAVLYLLTVLEHLLLHSLALRHAAIVMYSFLDRY